MFGDCQPKVAQLIDPLEFIACMWPWADKKVDTGCHTKHDAG